MTGKLCGSCGAATKDTTLCWACSDRLTELLHAVPAVLRDLATVIDRRGAAEQATVARDVLVDVLVGRWLLPADPQPSSRPDAATVLAELDAAVARARTVIDRPSIG